MLSHPSLPMCNAAFDHMVYYSLAYCCSLDSSILTAAPSGIASLTAVPFVSAFPTNPVPFDAAFLTLVPLHMCNAADCFARHCWSPHLN